MPPTGHFCSIPAATRHRAGLSPVPCRPNSCHPGCSSGSNVAPHWYNRLRSQTMAAHNDPVILLVSDNKSTSEIVQTQLSEFDRLIIPEDMEGVLHAYRKHNPDVIILGYDQLEKCEQVYDRLYPKDKDQNPAQKPHRVIALCNKREVKHAYDLCNSDRFTDYIVFWPLTYDPFRLAMSVH